MSDREGSSAPLPPSVRRRRGLTVVAAAAGAAALWLLAVPALGVALRAPMAGHPPMTIGLPQVVLTAAVVSAAAWALLAALERITARAKAIWSAVAAAALVVSYAAPLSVGAPVATTVVLLLMHTTVGLILLAGMRRTVPGPLAQWAGNQAQRSVAG